MKDRLSETCKIPPLHRCFSGPYKLPSATPDQPFGSMPNLNRFQPAPVVPARTAPVVPARTAPVVPARAIADPTFLPARAAPVVRARATADPTFMLSLMALYMALSIYPQNMVKKRDFEWTGAELLSGLFISMGMDVTFYVLINWVADIQYPILSWLALIIGNILFWISQSRNLPFILDLPVVTAMNAFLFGSLAAKITRNVGWGVAYQFLLDNISF